MKTKMASFLRCLITVTPLILNAGATGAPLAWFRGPPLIEPTSGAATTAVGGFGNVLIGGAASGDFPFPISLGATSNSWTVLAPLYGLNIAPGVAGSGDPLLVYGGSNGSNSTNAAIYYSQSGDPVSAVPSMNAARSYLGYATDRDGKAYALGGLDENGSALASAETIVSDSPTAWSFIASLPTALYNFPAVYDGTNRIYVFGGDTGSGTEANGVFYYSVNANTWTPAASMPIAVAGSGAARGVDGKFYVVGGVSGGVTVNVVQVYDPASNSWAISTPLPQELSAIAMGVDSLGRLLVMGGADTNGLAVANVWRSQQLGIPDSAPAFTQYPATNGRYQIPYVSSITATGAPPPYYMLVSGPSGMAVDQYSGGIAWTPQASQIGSNSVTIRATNYAGFVDWTFNITVAPPPPLVPTNLALLGRTDTSLTLSWDPENPLVGQVTYSVYYVTSTGGRDPIPIYNPLGTTPTNVVTIGGLQVAHAYNIVVKASANGITTGYSARFGVATTGPQPPSYVRLTGLTSTTLSLAWAPGTNVNPNLSPTVSYSIGQYSGGQFIPKATGITDTFGTVTGLTPGSGAFWTVEAYDADGFGALNVFWILGVNNPVPVPPLTSGGQALPGGNFQFNVQEGGSVVQTVLIEANTDLTNPSGWVQIGSVFPSSSLFTFTDTNAALYPMRFYKVTAP